MEAALEPAFRADGYQRSYHFRMMANAMVLTSLAGGLFDSSFRLSSLLLLPIALAQRRGFARLHGWEDQAAAQRTMASAMMVSTTVAWGLYVWWSHVRVGPLASLLTHSVISTQMVIYPIYIQLFMLSPAQQRVAAAVSVAAIASAAQWSVVGRVEQSILHGAALACGFGVAHVLQEQQRERYLERTQQAEALRHAQMPAIPLQCDDPSSLGATTASSTTTSSDGSMTGAAPADGGGGAPGLVSSLDGIRASGARRLASLIEELEPPGLIRGDGRPKHLNMDGWQMAAALGRGRFGVALLFSSPAHAYPCVVKKVDTLAMPEEGLRLLANELHIARALMHPHLIAFLGYFMDADSCFCLVFEYAPNGNLQTLIGTQARATGGGGGFATARVRRWLAQLASALAYMHNLRVVHRDVTASNVFLTSAEDAKLGDFGVSKVMSSVTSGQTLCGTPSYMCPEVLKGEGCGPAGDVWALGVILYQLLCLRCPFVVPEGAYYVALMQQISTFDGTFDAPTAAALDGSGHPAELRELASGRGLLHPTPDLRFPLAELLERFPVLP